MSSIDIDRVVEQLKVDEGYRPRVYLCSANVQTVGYGHNLEDTDIPEHIAAALLDWKVAQVTSECTRFDWFDGLSAIRKEVIINMVFNLGFTGVSKFKNMIAAIYAGDWPDVGHEMLDSKWHSDVGERAERLARMMVNDRGE